MDCWALFRSVPSVKVFEYQQYTYDNSEYGHLSQLRHIATVHVCMTLTVNMDTLGS